MSAFRHDCDDVAMPLGGQCTCGSLWVTCSICSDDLTEHRADCDNC